MTIYEGARGNRCSPSLLKSGVPPSQVRKTQRRTRRTVCALALLVPDGTHCEPCIVCGRQPAPAAHEHVRSTFVTEQSTRLKLERQYGEVMWVLSTLTSTRVALRMSFSRSLPAHFSFCVEGQTAPMSVFELDVVDVVVTHR